MAETQLGTKVLISGNVYRWKSGTLTKDGVAFDLSAQTVHLWLFAPDGTGTKYVTTGSSLGVAGPYVGDGTELTAAKTLDGTGNPVGRWLAAWFVVGFGWYDPVAFSVKAPPIPLPAG